MWDVVAPLIHDGIHSSGARTRNFACSPCSTKLGFSAAWQCLSCARAKVTRVTLRNAPAYLPRQAPFGLCASLCRQCTPFPSLLRSRLAGYSWHGAHPLVVWVPLDARRRRQAIGEATRKNSSWGCHPAHVSTHRSLEPNRITSLLAPRAQEGVGKHTRNPLPQRVVEWTAFQAIQGGIL